jgi:hypothetical protein
MQTLLSFYEYLWLFLKKKRKEEIENSMHYRYNSNVRKMYVQPLCMEMSKFFNNDDCDWLNYKMMQIVFILFCNPREIC